jgi:ribosome biogenesis GTPase
VPSLALPVPSLALPVPSLALPVPSLATSARRSFMPEPRPSKHKGTVNHHPRHGLGRLRRAHAVDATRITGWEQRTEDEAFIDAHGATQRRSHAGEHLLAKFNRLAGLVRPEAIGEPGVICGFLGKDVSVRVDADGRELLCTVRQVLKKQVSGVKNPLCVGDLVQVDCSSDPVITAVAARRNQLARTDSHNRSLIHIFAANIDRLVIVSSVRDPDLKYGLIDRYLLIAALNDIPVVLALNKADLGAAEEAIALYRSLGVTVAVTSAIHGGPALEELRSHLQGLACVFAGQSGVGKSSLVNALFPHFAARIGAVAEEGHGRHTTTAARSYALPDGGRLIDTPGVRECAICGLTPVDVALLYSDFAALHRDCHFADCSHLHEPGCAVQAAVADGRIAKSRYESYRSIVTEDLRA